MDGHTIGLLSEYIAELRRRDRHSDRDRQCGTQYPTQQVDTGGAERNTGRDERCGTDDPRKGRDNL